MALPDERILDHDADHHACDCFLCGRKVYRGNVGTGTYSSNASFAPELLIHLSCLEGREMTDVAALYMHAISDADKVIRQEEQRARLALGQMTPQAAALVA